MRDRWIPAAKKAEEWQNVGRDWYVMGHKERGDICHMLADYWRLPLILRILFTSTALRLRAALRESMRLQRVENIMQSIAKELDHVEEDH